MTTQSIGKPNAMKSLPPEAYVNHAWFEKEAEGLFPRAWHPVAREEWFNHAGDYFVVDILGRPIVIMRDGDGSLSAYSNVCLHRACTLLDGRGQISGSSYSCPYHRWRYSLDGSLINAPLMEGNEDFNVEQQRLPRVRLEVWLGWVYVNLDPNAAALASQLTTLESVLREARFDEMVTYDKMTFRSAWNWKVMVDNFVESYHHMGPHTKTLSPYYPPSTTYAVPSDGPYTLLENPAADEHSGSFWVACVFPTTLVAVVRSETPSALWYQMEINNPGEFQLHIHLMTTPELAENESFTEQHRSQTRTIHQEDIEICERVSKGLKSPLAVSGELSKLEACNWQFYKWYLEEIAKAGKGSS